MSMIAMAYLACAVAAITTATALAMASLHFAYIAGNYAAHPGQGLFELPDEVASGIAVLTAFGAGALFTLTGALLHASLAAA